MRRVELVLALIFVASGLLAQQLPFPQQPSPYQQQPAPYQQQPYSQQPYQQQPNQPYPPQQQPYQAQPAQQDYPDQPGQPVARLSVINGDASVRRGDSGDWVAAVLNAPLMAGDSISVPPGGKAELQLDNGNYVRIGGDTEVRISDLEQGRNQIQLARGLITYRTLRESNSQGEISTPGLAVHPLRLSAVRVEIAPDGMTRIVVRHGDAEISSPKGTEHMHEGNMMLLRGTPDEPEYQIVAAAARDAWDGFNDQRDNYLMHAQSNRYLSPDVSGGEDLDNYGTWGNDPQYGNVWTPNVPPAWAPYHDGQWVWEDPYGWTWIDAAPWGWAPSHYGSWYFRVGFGWSWFPGPRFAHYWYHPAMVGFFGFGGVGVGFGFGNVGWVPLAPFEHFRPWYGPRGFGVGVNVNLIHNTNIAGVYRNAGVVGGAVAVSGADFQRGVFRNQIPVSRAQLAQASLVRGALPITPTASNLRFSERAATTAGPHSEIGSQRFFSRSPVSASAAQRTPFAQQQAAMRSSFAGTERAGAERAGGQANAPQAGGSGWQRFGSPNAAGASGARPAASGGWDRFGSPQGGGQAAPQQRYAGPTQGNQSFQRPGAVQVAPRIVQPRQAAPAPAPRGGTSSSRSSSGSRASSGKR